MDPLGNVVREFLREKHASNVRNALSIAIDLRDDEGMKLNQIEEMLYSSGFESEVIVEALNYLPKQKKKANR